MLEDLRVLAREVAGDEDLPEVAEHPAQVRLLRVGEVAPHRQLARVVGGEEGEEHELLESRRALAVVLEDEDRRGEVAHGPRPEEEHRVRRALDGLVGSLVVRAVGGAQHLEGQRVVAQDDVGESLNRRVVLRHVLERVEGVLRDGGKVRLREDHPHLDLERRPIVGGVWLPFRGGSFDVIQHGAARG